MPMMDDLLAAAAFVVGWYVLQRFVLRRSGVST